MNQTFWTIIAGVSVFALGQILNDFILKPIRDYIRVKGEISHKVKFHSNILTSSNVKQKLVTWATGDMRDLSSQLESRYLVIPFKTLFECFKIIPPRKDIREATKILIFLSNAGGVSGSNAQNGDEINKLKKLLNIEL